MVNKIRSYLKRLDRVQADLQANRILTGRLLVHQLRSVETLADAEFRVFSQFGDDGIIQYLIHHARIRSSRFVEFGVEDYQEANTRFLLMNDNWRGLIMDGSARHIDAVRAESWFWQYDITAKAAFITAENINDLLTESGFTGPLGLLSMDIDGNDYWVWQAITVADPDIVVVEYNSLFGDQRAITVPYQTDFVRQKAHYSYLYFGASLPALCELADTKRYSFVGCNRAGNNAYFVKTTQLGSMKALTAAEGFVQSAFRESRNQAGQLSFVAGEQRANLIRGLPVYNIRTGTVEPF